MIFPGSQIDRNYAFYFAKKMGYKYYYEGMESAGTTTFHYLSKDEYNCILGYYAFHMVNNTVVNVDMIAYERNSTLFKDFIRSLKTLEKIIDAFYLTIHVESPALNLAKNTFAKFNGCLLETVGERYKFMWIRGGLHGN